MGASEKYIKADISSAQLRAGRALIGWSQDQLANQSGVHKRTIARMELAPSPARQKTIAALRSALEAAGVDFIEPNGGGAGVRLRLNG